MVNTVENGIGKKRYAIWSGDESLDQKELIRNVFNNEDNFNITNVDLSIGIDPIMGDIVMNKNELAIIRGGWKDRHDIYYYDNLDYNKVCSINININGITNKNINN